MTNDLETTLDALVADAPVDRADWSDVRRRARRPQQRRALVLAIVAAMTTIAVVTPAFGLGSRMLDLFEGTPASPEVQQLFADWNSRSAEWGATLGHVPPANLAAAQAWIAQRYPLVDASKAHGIFSVELSPSVVLQLWAAPIGGGGECSILLRADQVDDLDPRGGHTSLCITSTTPVAPRGGATLGMGVPGRGVMPGTAPGAASVEIRFADGTTLEAPVVEGFFLAPVGLSQIGMPPTGASRLRADPSRVVTQIISYDAQGRQLAETTSEQKVIADYLGITVAELSENPPSYHVNVGGTTLAQMAVERGRSVNGLVDAIVAHATVGLDAQVAAGLMTAADETSALAVRRRAAEGMVQGLPPTRVDRPLVTPRGLPATTPPAAATQSIGVVSFRAVFPAVSLWISPCCGARLSVVTAGSPILIYEVTIHNGGDARKTDVPVTVTIDLPDRLGGPIVSTGSVDTIGVNETKTTTVTFNDLQVPFALPIDVEVKIADGPVQVYPTVFALPR